MATPEKCPDRWSPYTLTAARAAAIAQQIAALAEQIRESHPGMAMSNCVDVAIAAWDIADAVGTIADVSE